MTLQEEAHWFTVDGERVFGILHPAEQSNGTILLLHGFTGSHIGDKYAFVDLGRALNDAGFTVFRFDYRGSGNSEGAFADQRLGTTVRDVHEAIRYLREHNVETGSLGVLGHSMGGSTALLAAQDLDVDALATWSTVADYSDLWVDRIAGDEEVTIYGFQLPRDTIDDLFHHDFRAYAAGIDAPTLFIHGKKDRSVPHQHSEQLHEAANDPSELAVMPRSDHVFSNPDEREDVIRKTVDWFSDTIG